ncbi:hypothetical protein DFH09DRAFT_594975 [Mycena vulgaris]|nr:hypothetical protein DFH09DRAFT_594975 [Mycena vulgaris]
MVDVLTLPHAPRTIQNGTFIGGNVNNTVRNGESGTCLVAPSGPSSKSTIPGINILHRISAVEAFHDPADSYAQPRCHPETRIEMQETLLNWCINSEWPPTESGEKSGEDMTLTEPAVLWVHGPAGAGKSAVMETLSQRLEETTRLGGAFFFKRGHPTRGNAKVLFATIALQLAVHSPELRARISLIVEDNPTLVDRSIGVQLRELILKPCSAASSQPWIIVIDGLDECEGQNIQQDILRLILDSTRQPRPLRFIIASRPETHIRELLDGVSFHGLYRAFNVEKSFDDVRRYLVAEFVRIHHEHSTMVAVPKPWPSEEVINRLVHSSSGYFIHSSTVIKFVDDKNFRPTQRLEVILTGTDLKSPFGALDGLYTQILSMVPESRTLVPIIRVIDHFTGLSTSQIEALLGLESGDASLSLRSLHSVIEFMDGDTTPFFIHASFGQFLRSFSRAGEFCVNDPAALADLARLVLAELGYMYDDPIKNRTPLLALIN